jgi:CRISPR/Cas system CSM-associated protein Csm3 (group 7 of RAMP superfamily)
VIQLRSLLNSPPSNASTLSLTAILDTALCIGAGGSSGSLADKPIVRRADGRLVIPGSQLKGRLRHECEKLARGLGWEVFEAPLPALLFPRPASASSLAEVAGYPGFHCLISQIFGNPVLPSRVIVEDLVCPLSADELPDVFRPGVSINRRRRVADDQKLFLLETSPARAGLLFSGQIQLLPGLPVQAKPLIVAGLQHIHALGGSKSTGLGWLSWKLTADSIEPNFDWSQLLPPGGER